ncbi:BEM_collapsed_G0016650.mRNA.1.CDS.1 [Saccharomyces cerevisiae]|nr:BEM_collapsed_G0016650.mRNA.1.CDS.1 [Saccharomyces cerevisiae]
MHHTGISSIDRIITKILTLVSQTELRTIKEGTKRTSYAQDISNPDKHRVETFAKEKQQRWEKDLDRTNDPLKEQRNRIPQNSSNLETDPRFIRDSFDSDSGSSFPL